MISKLKDINYLEASILVVLCIVSLVFGFYPEPLLNTMDISVNGIIENHQNELSVNLMNKNNGKYIFNITRNYFIPRICLALMVGVF